MATRFREVTCYQNSDASHVLRESANLSARDILQVESIECIPFTSITAKVEISRENRFTIVVERSDNGIRDYPFRALSRPL